MSTARLWPLCTNVARRLRSYALGTLALVMLVWAFVTVSGYAAGAGSIVVQLREDKSMVTWQTLDGDTGALFMVYATDADATARGLTLRQWVDHLKVEFPPYIPPPPAPPPGG